MSGSHSCVVGKRGFKSEINKDPGVRWCWTTVTPIRTPKKNKPKKPWTKQLIILSKCATWAILNFQFVSFKIIRIKSRNGSRPGLATIHQSYRSSSQKMLSHCDHDSNVFIQFTLFEVGFKKCYIQWKYCVTMFMKISLRKFRFSD